MANWMELLPDTKGVLPGGRPLRRTNPSGECRAKVVFLGVYPAATTVKPMLVGNQRLNLPVEVEAESFELGSASGREFEEHYLRPLELERADVLITDILPYYLANTTASGTEGRSMSDNVCAYEAEHGRTGIDPRPPPDELVALARTMPGNLDRLSGYLGSFGPTLLLTLGAEVAAFVRGVTHSAIRADEVLYGEPQLLTVCGRELMVVHLVHPHLFIKRNEVWMERHRDWIAQRGRALVAHHAGRRTPSH